MEQNATPQPRLWTRDFRLLAAGLLISYVGDAFFDIGFIWVALTLTGNPLVVGTVLAVYGLPPLLLGPFAGTLVDTWNKRWLMLLGDGVRGLIVLLVYFLLRAGALPVWLLYLSALLLSVCDILYKPSLRILVPALVPDAQLPAANSFIQGGQQFAQIVGASLAGIVVAVLGTGTTLLIDAASFFVSALALYLIRFAARLTQAQRATVSDVLVRTWGGLKYCFTQADLLTVLVLAFGMNLVLSPVNVVFPVYSRDTIGGGAAAFGWLSGAIAVGMLVGSVLVGSVGKGLRAWTSIGVGVMVLVLGFVALALVKSVPLAVGCTAILGAAAPLIQVPMVTQLQREVPPELMGRTFATFNTVGTAAVPLGSALAGTALHAFAPPAFFLFAAVGLLVVAGTLGVYRRVHALRAATVAK